MNKTVKLQFESGLEYQRAAIDAVCDLFEGLEKRESPFSIREMPEGGGLGLETLGYGNALNIRDELLNPFLLNNLRAVQERNGLPVDNRLESRDFTVEMETGTGKTYVYLRTICELHRRYGLSRFVIVVPSVAIKEGVTKSIELMREHFRSLYDGMVLDSFTYDSKRVSEVGDFARRSTLKVMVCTKQVITDIEPPADDEDARARRVMYQPNEKTGGLRPIVLIQKCRPVVIVDEPQKLGPAGERNGLKNLHPLCTLRYSATHKKAFHPVYRLSAVDAASQNLVKEIEVASIEKECRRIGPYLRLVGAEERDGALVAHVKLRVRNKNGNETLGNCDLFIGDSLQDASGNPAVYPPELTVKDIRRTGQGRKQKRYLVLNTPQGEREVYENDSYSDDDLVREMMAVTIESHLEKSLHLRRQGIKVLSLFFLDSVSHYKIFDEENKREEWGEYARLFEEIYTQIASKPKYETLFDGAPLPAAMVHDGYFARSKKKGAGQMYVDSNGADEKSRSAYELIMKDKERLLSLDEPLQFIFTHSALQEGWDNPNVFQICILRDIQTTISRRQALGRGLRLCVNADGERVYDTNINRLTVVARESVKEFAAKLQKEYEDEGCRFGVVTVERMGTLRYTDADGDTRVLGQAVAKLIVDEFRKEGMLRDDKPTAELREALEQGTLQMPASCPVEAWAGVRRLLSVQSRGVEVQEKRERRRPVLNKEKYDSPLFRELWNRIKYRTTYRSRFDSGKLIEAVLKDLPDALESVRHNVVVHYNDVDVTEAGVNAQEVRRRILDSLGEASRGICDVLAYLEDATNLTRRTLSQILLGLPEESLKLIHEDEQGFLKTVIHVIRKHLSHIRSECLEYVPVTVGEKEYEAHRFLEPLDDGYTDTIWPRPGEPPLSKCLTDCVVYQKGVESNFAKSAELCENVKLYFKLPSWFTIPVPKAIGSSYNPDWAVVMEKDGRQDLYFVVETKSEDTLVALEDGVGVSQADKIRCGRAHFAESVQNKAHALVPPVVFRAPVVRAEDVLR